MKLAPAYRLRLPDMELDISLSEFKISLIVIITGLYFIWTQIDDVINASKSIEAYTLSSNLRNELAVYYAQHGELPADTQAAFNPALKDGKYTTLPVYDNYQWKAGIQDVNLSVSLYPLLLKDNPHSPLLITCDPARFAPHWQSLAAPPIRDEFSICF